MSRLFPILTAVLLAGAQAPPPGGPAIPLEIIITVPPGPGGAVTITMETTRDPDGITNLDVTPEWAGLPPRPALYADLAVTDGNGAPMSHRLGAATESLFAVEHADTRGRIRWSWRLSPNAYIHAVGTSQLYYPLVADDFIQLIGHTGLLLPDHLGVPGTRIHLTYRFEGLSARGWQAGTSFGGARSGAAVMTNWQDLRGSLWTAGRAGADTRAANGTSLRTLVAEAAWDVTAPAVADTVEDMLKAALYSLGPLPGFNSFFVSMVPVGGPDAREQVSMRGTSLYRAFTLLSTPAASLNLDNPATQQTLRILMHELLHQWVGQRITVAADEQARGYWFTEGVTDYLTLRLMLEGGIIDEAGFETWINDVLGDYYRSPHMGLSRDEAAGRFWQEESVQEFVYRRGTVLAFMLDLSGADLPDMIRTLNAEAGDEPMTMSPGALEERIAERVPGPVMAAFRAALAGERLAFPPGLGGACGVLDDIRYYDYELGFDRRLEQGIPVTGVVPGSAAWDAGLRDGLILRGWSLQPGNPHYEVTLHVSERPRSAIRTLTYMPQGKELGNGKQFEILNADRCWT